MTRIESSARSKETSTELAGDLHALAAFSEADAAETLHGAAETLDAIFRALTDLAAAAQATLNGRRPDHLRTATANAQTLIAMHSRRHDRPAATIHRPHQSNAATLVGKETTMPYGFRWISSFLNIDHYEVTGDGPTYRIETRRRTTQAQEAYQRSIFRGDDAQWERDVIGATDLVFRVPASDKPLTQAVVDAFNAWRIHDHAEQLAAILQRFGMDNHVDNAPTLDAPPIVRGARYVTGQGWVASESKEPAAQCGDRGKDDAPTTALPPYRLDPALRLETLA